MKYYNYILIIFCALIFHSCDSYLDIKPTGIQIPEYYDDYLRLLNNKSLMYSDYSYSEYLTDDVLLGGTEVQFGRFDQAMNIKKNLYSFEPGAILSEGESDYLWNNAYSRIYTFNVIINNVGTCTDHSTNDVNGLIAQAKVARAFEFFNLVNIYSKIYDKSTAGTDYGIPLVISEDINKSYKRNTVQEVYDFIESDLKEAEKYIPEKAPHKFRANKQFLYALFSKIYLYKGEYENSLKYAELAFKQGYDIIDLKKYAINPAGNGMGRIHNPETNEQYPVPEKNNECIYIRYSNDLIGLSRNIYLSQDLLDLYKQDLPENAIDQRRALFASDDQFKLYNTIYKFPGKTMWVAYIQPNAGINYTELLLMMAEDYARTNKIKESMDLVNIIRDNRIKNNVHLSANNEESALNYILDEKRREFAMMGSLRLTELKRLNKEARFQKTITHYVGETAYTLAPNDNKYIFPLPPDVLSHNPNIPVYER